MSGKAKNAVLGPSDRIGSPTSSRPPSPKASPKVTPAPKLASEGVSPGKAAEKAEGKKKEEKGNKSKNKSGKDKKQGKEPEEFFALIPAGTPFAQLGSLKELEDTEACNELIVKKLELCMKVYNFQRDDEMPEKEGKRFTLLEILNNWPAEISDGKKKNLRSPALTGLAGDDGTGSGSGGPLALSESSEVSSKGLLSQQVTATAVRVVKANAFRAIQHKDRTPMDMLDGDDDEPYLEPTWPHLELVYELLLKVVMTKDMDGATAQSIGLDKAFVASLIDLIDTDDPREREVLKNLIVKIFGKLSNLRSTVRKSIQSFCSRAVALEHGEAPAYGLAELLEILGQRIVAGFATPLRKEQKNLLTQILLPLYKLDFLSFFLSQLKDVVRTFCKKDASLHKPVAQALLRYWPQCASSKQVIFLGELEDMIHAMSSADFKSIAVECAHRISNCCVSPHSEVAEKALGIWRHQPTTRSTVQNCRDDLPLIISRLYTNVTQAWGPNVMSKTMDVLKNFMEADRELFDNCSSKHRKQADEVEKKEKTRLARWAQLQELHDLAHPESKKNVRPREAREPKASGRPQLTCNEEIALKPDSSCAYSLCWDWASEPTKEQLILQALLVNTDGKIIEAIHSRNITGFQSAVRLTARAPAKNSKETCCGTIWVSLDLLPVEVAMVLYVVTASSGSLLGSIAHDMSLVVDFNGNVQLGEILAEPPNDAHMGLLAVQKRLDWNSWNLLPKIEWSPVAHFLESQEVLGTVIKEVLPQAPKKQRGQASFVAMSKGSVADCPHFTGKTMPARIFMGVGWDFYSEQTVEIQVALVLFNADGQQVSTVCKDGQNVKGTFHTGQGTLSAGVFLEFDALPIEVSVGFLVANMESSELDFGAIQQPHCTVIDAAGREVLRYFMPEDRKSSSGQQGLVMARIFWNQFLERWSFQALGNYCAGSSWSASVEDMQRLMTVPPSSFQTLLLEDEDSVTRGDHRSTTAAYMFRPAPPPRA